MKKLEIYDLYFNKKLSIIEISKVTKYSKQNISYILKQDPKYEKEKLKRINEQNQKQLEQNKKIQNMYLELKLTRKKISEELNVSAATITRALKLSDKYILEKKNKKLQQLLISNAKCKDRLNEQYIVSNMMKLQEQNARSMSRTRKITEQGLVEINLQHYVYNSEKQKLVYDGSCGARPNDLRNSINVHSFKGCNTKLFEESFEDSL